MDIGAPELLIILFVILLLFGPGRIAKLGGELGKGMRAFKDGLAGKAEPEKKEKEPDQPPQSKSGQ